MSSPGSRPTTPRQAPGLAEAVVELLNSRPHATPRTPDTLTDAASAAPLLLLFGRTAAAPLSDDDVAQVRSLRQALTEAVHLPGTETGHAAWTEINRLAATTGFHHAFDGDGSVDQHQVSGSPAAGAVIRAIAALVAGGQFSRVRICAHPDCQHAFYDATRSGNQRWHSYEVCGNRANVAAHRTRAKYGSVQRTV
ncbi:CGNR zinc finger domain-containing protein [Streptomyces sp. NPDC006207]|nr:CGNR zinc finger domain-containing protein [Streptomyces sp. PA03-5A]MDX2854228.1 CGNR zinc finger domain-containing protein [Streptomyces sp. PA03-3a]